MIVSNRTVVTHDDERGEIAIGGTTMGVSGQWIMDMDAADTGYMTASFGGGSKVIDYNGTLIMWHLIN